MNTEDEQLLMKSILQNKFHYYHLPPTLIMAEQSAICSDHLTITILSSLWILSNIHWRQHEQKMKVLTFSSINYVSSHASGIKMQQLRNLDIHSCRMVAKNRVYLNILDWSINVNSVICDFLLLFIVCIMRFSDSVLNNQIRVFFLKPFQCCFYTFVKLVIFFEWCNSLQWSWQPKFNIFLRQQRYKQFCFRYNCFMLRKCFVCSHILIRAWLGCSQPKNNMTCINEIIAGFNFTNTSWRHIDLNIRAVLQ